MFHDSTHFTNQLVGINGGDAIVHFDQLKGQLDLHDRIQHHEWEHIGEKQSGDRFIFTTEECHRCPDDFPGFPFDSEIKIIMQILQW